jgi:Sporulation related domain.
MADPVLEEVKPLPVIMEDQVPLPQDSISKYEKHLSEWKKLRPGIEKLVAIEAELIQLIDQLNQMANDNSKAVPVNHNESSPSMEKNMNVNIAEEAKTIIQKKPVLEESQPEKNRATVLEKPTHAVQLASVRNKNKLTQAWMKIKQKAPQLLSSLKPSYEQVNVKGIIYYRLKAGSFNTLANGENFCEQLKQHGVKCVITTFGGNNLLTI